MRSIVRGLGLVAACGALLAAAGCGEDNEKAILNTQAPVGKGSGPVPRTQEEYGKQQAARGNSMYKSQGYPGAK